MRNIIMRNENLIVKILIAIYGMFLPGFSSITLFFDLIGQEGFFNNFTTMVIIWLVSVIVLVIPMFVKDNN